MTLVPTNKALTKLVFTRSKNSPVKWIANFREIAANKQFVSTAFQDFVWRAVHGSSYINEARL
jgi:hypothetical protein